MLMPSVFLVFTWRHGGHVGAPKQRNDGHVGPQFILRELISIFMQIIFFVSVRKHAVDHVSENQEYCSILD